MRHSRNMINCQTLKKVESFLYPGTPVEGRRIQWPKHCVMTDNKDEDNSPKNNTEYKLKMIFKKK